MRAYLSLLSILFLLISNYTLSNEIKNYNCNINLSTSIKNISPLEMSAPSEIKIIYDLDTNNLIDYFWDKKSIIDNSELASTNIHSKFIKITRKGYKKTLLDAKYFISVTLTLAPATHAEIICKPSLSVAIILAKYFLSIN